MITEDYVSFEAAKLLKEKGFIGTANNYSYLYSKDGVFGHRNSIWSEEIFPAPTLQMACKWLREVHNLHVDIGYDDLDWFWNIISISEDVPIADRPKFIVTGTACHRTYEEAVEAAIKYTLKNLIIEL